MAAVAAFMVKRGKAPGPFFVFLDSMPLTKAKFMEIVRNTLGELRLLKEHFASHSFRIGVARAMAQAGLEDSMIMTLGRCSAAFLRYIRNPKVMLAAATTRLSRLPAD